MGRTPSFADFPISQMQIKGTSATKRDIPCVARKGFTCFTLRPQQKGTRQANQFRRFVSLLMFLCPSPLPLSLPLFRFGQGPRHPFLDAETNSTRKRQKVYKIKSDAFRVDTCIKFIVIVRYGSLSFPL